MLVDLLNRAALVDATKMEDVVIEDFIRSFTHAILAKDLVSIQINGGHCMSCELTLFEFSEAKIDTDRKKFKFISNTANVDFSLTFQEIKSGNPAANMDKYYFFSEDVSVTITMKYTLSNHRSFTSI